jgi:hypothetical protein
LHDHRNDDIGSPFAVGSTRFSKSFNILGYFSLIFFAPPPSFLILFLERTIPVFSSFIPT